MKLKITTLALAAICCFFVSAQSSVKNKQIENGEWQINSSLLSKQASSDMEMEKMSPQFLRDSAPMLIKNAEIVAFGDTPELRAATATDSTLYFRPQGFFFAGLTPKYIAASSSLNILFGPSNVPVTWRNLSSYPSTAYSWKLPDPDATDSGASITSTEMRPTQTFLFGVYDVIPTLTSTTANNTKEAYKWGAHSAANDRLFAGATITYMLDGGIEVPACNYDAQQAYESFAFQAANPAAEGYLYGRRTDGLVDAVGNFFEKPLHPYTIDRVWVHALECTAPAGTEFELIIHKVTYNENRIQLTDTLATSKITIEQVTGPLNAGLHYTLMFDRLMVFDEEFGLEMETAYIVVEDEILVELKGFNKEGVEFGVLGQANGTAGKDHNAAIFVQDAQKGRQLSVYANFHTNLLFNLDVTYSFLFADSDIFEAPQAGGSKDFEISCLYATAGISEYNVDMPAWITSTFLRPDADDGTLYTITVAELPANIPYREYTIWLYTKGASFPITITQGSGSSVGNAMEHQVNVVSNADEFQLTYPAAAFQKVSVWSITGVLVNEYVLPPEGKFAIPTNSLPQGIYILKLTGNGSKSVKVIK